MLQKTYRALLFPFLLFLLPLLFIAAGLFYCYGSVLAAIAAVKSGLGSWRPSMQQP